MDALNKGNKDSALQIVNNDAQIANEGVLATALKINEYQEGQLKVITDETKQVRNRGAGYHDDANNAMLAMWRVEKEDFVSFHSI